MIKKISKIAKAYSGSLPINEVWYKDRLSICNGCPYNTKNIDPEDVGFGHKVVKKATNGEVCTACGCNIERKASLMESVCGLDEIGKEPKWKALQSSSITSDGFKLVSSGTAVVSDDEGSFSVKIETSEPLIKVPLFIESSEDFDLLSANPSCGCTLAKVDRVSPRRAKLDLSISTLKFNKGYTNTKSVQIKYKKDGGVKFFTIKLKIDLI